MVYQISCRFDIPTGVTSEQRQVFDLFSRQSVISFQWCRWGSQGHAPPANGVRSAVMNVTPLGQSYIKWDIMNNLLQIWDTLPANRCKFSLNPILPNGSDCIQYTGRIVTWFWIDQTRIFSWLSKPRVTLVDIYHTKKKSINIWTKKKQAST